MSRASRCPHRVGVRRRFRKFVVLNLPVKAPALAQIVPQQRARDHPSNPGKRAGHSLASPGRATSDDSRRETRTALPRLLWQAAAAQKRQDRVTLRMFSPFAQACELFLQFAGPESPTLQRRPAGRLFAPAISANERSMTGAFRGLSASSKCITRSRDANWRSGPSSSDELARLSTPMPAPQ